LDIKVLRFTNEEVLKDIEHVLGTIKKHLTLNPSPGWKLPAGKGLSR